VGLGIRSPHGLYEWRSTEDQRLVRCCSWVVAPNEVIPADVDAHAAADSLLMGRMAFVTGKGGVGKTTVAAALWLLATARGRDAVACPLGSIDPDDALAEWMARNIGRAGAALLSRSDAFRYFVAAAPGARELISIGKAWDLTRDGSRLVVVDGPSSGHAVGLLQAPFTFGRIDRIGPIGQQARQISDFLADPARCAIALVCTPHEMPVTETLELAAAIEAVTDRRADVVIANQVLPDRFDDDEIDCIEAALSNADDPCLRAACRQAIVAWRRAREQEHQLARLRAEAIAPIIELPFLFVPSLGLDELRTLRRALTDGDET
jgi:anion-transporting  ArsA/GET3 family ATPase